MSYRAYTKQNNVPVSPNHHCSKFETKTKPILTPLHLAPILCADEFDGGCAVALSPRGVEGARRIHGVRTDGNLIST